MSTRQKIFKFGFLLGFMVLLLVSAYFVIKFPFGTNNVINTLDIGDLYWNADRKDYKYEFVTMKEKNKKKLRKKLEEKEFPALSVIKNINNAAALCDWVHHQLSFGKPFPDTDWHTFTLLDKAAKGEKFLCDEYAALFAAIAQAYNAPARVFHIKGERTQGHFLTEVWLSEKQKWVMIDPLFNLYVTLSAEPLSIKELYALSTENFNGVKEHQKAVTNETLKFSKKYLKYFNLDSLNLIMRNDFISRPSSFKSLFFSSPQRFLLFDPDIKLKTPYSKEEEKKLRIKIIGVTALSFVFGALCPVILRKKKG